MTAGGPDARNGGPTAAADDPELIEAARSGDREAAEQLLSAHIAGIHAVCRRLCRDPGDAQDAAQEAAIAVVRGLRRFDGRSNLSTWVYRVTTNACMDELRRRRRFPEPVGGDDERPRHSEPALLWSAQPAPDPEQGAERSELRDQLLDALGHLGEDYRVAVVLRDVADLDYAAIAEITGVPIGTVRSRIARGRSRMADALAALDQRIEGTNSAPAPSDGSEDR